MRKKISYPDVGSDAYSVPKILLSLLGGRGRRGETFVCLMAGFVVILYVVASQQAFYQIRKSPCLYFPFFSASALSAILNRIRLNDPKEKPSPIKQNDWLRKGG